MDCAFLGLDVSKADVYAVMLLDNRKRRLSFPNDPNGFEKLQGWILKNTDLPVHACLESTGSYGLALAFFLRDGVAKVSVVNPRKIKHFGIATGKRSKTDPIDADTIAEYCRALQPREWTPPSPKQLTLRALTRRRDDLIKMLTSEQTRAADPGCDGRALDYTKEHIEFLKQSIEQINDEIVELIGKDPDLARMHRLMLSIPGIGDATAAVWLAEVGDCADFENARQLAAFLGLAPRLRESGSSVRKKPRMSKEGNAVVRKALFFPAMSAMAHCPHLKDFRERKIKQGKPRPVIVGAVMRKLVHTIFGVIRSNTPYDPLIAAGHLTT